MAARDRVERAAAPLEGGDREALLLYGWGELSYKAFRGALQESYATPAQLAALYEAAARIPGVTRDPAARDHDGRPGTGFAFDDTNNQIRTQVVVDPETHALLGVTATTLPGFWDDYEPGTVIGWTVIERVEVVDRVKERP